MTVQLVDTTDGGVVWGDRLQSSLADLPATRAAIVGRIVTALDQQIWVLRGVLTFVEGIAAFFARRARSCSPPSHAPNSAISSSTASAGLAPMAVPVTTPSRRRGSASGSMWRSRRPRSRRSW